MKAYIGIDVSCAKKKRCPIVICTKKNGRLLPLLLAQREYKSPLGFGNAKTLLEQNNVEYAAAIKNYIIDVCRQHNLTPARIAIDAPLIPKRNDLKRRIAEQKLDSLKISCYATPSYSEFEGIIERGKAHLEMGGEVSRLPHSMQIFMLAGFAIYQALKNVAECIEIFPHATAKVLGTAGKHKTKDNQAYIQLLGISQYTGWPNSDKELKTVNYICSGGLHDKVDAYGAAWIASLDDEQRLALGEPSVHDAIYLPRLEQIRSFDVAPLNNGNVAHLAVPTGKPKNLHKSGATVASISSEEKAHGKHSKVCPACGEYTFKRWPWGWDAHAAHKCTGLANVEPIKRKREFKLKFL